MAAVLLDQEFGSSLWFRCTHRDEARWNSVRAAVVDASPPALRGRDAPWRRALSIQRAGALFNPQREGQCPCSQQHFAVFELRSALAL